MKIGVVSDSHGNIDLLESAVDWMIKKHRISVLYHLGDDYDDVKCLADRFLEIAQVPGLYDERYKNKSLPATMFEMVMGLSILLVHSLDKDGTEKDIQRSDIVLHGHTHKEELKLDNGRFFLNPGHIKGPLDKNMPPTFGLLTLLDRNISAVIYKTDFKPVRSMEMVRTESGLYKTF